MTKKHYIKLAEIINNNSRYGNIRDEIKRVIDLDNFYQDLVLFLKEDNPNFDDNKFWDALNKDAIVSE
tara:strand:+ start:670 stop:873 length:204 start_codon:yes stop_codon:yes gene_type:complete